MTDFIIKKLPYDLSSQAGLALVGQYLKRINFSALVDPKFPVRSGVANSDILRSYLGLLSLRNTDGTVFQGANSFMDKDLKSYLVIFFSSF
jgi:hypothetical protein